MSAGDLSQNGARPKVAFLVHRIPYPPDKGDKIRSYHELEALCRVADTTVACFVDDPDDARHFPRLRDMCEELITVRLHRGLATARSILAIAGRGPLSLAFYRSKEMLRRMDDLAARRRFDAVLVFSSTMAPYAAPFRGTHGVLDLCDLDSAKWAQFAERASFPMSRVYRTESQRLRGFELAQARAFADAVLVSEAEAVELRSDCPGARVRVVPNGVDLEYFDPEKVTVDVDPSSVVFCGAMDYRSNVDAVTWFHDDILPLVRIRHPDTRFKIVGSNPAREVRRLAARPGVEVTGRVPDVRPHLLGCAVSVAPLRIGRGVPNKILEALALTMPVVTTPNGAAGLALADFDAADVAAVPAGLAQAVGAHLESAEGGHTRYPQHRQILSERYSWRRHMGDLIRILLPTDEEEDSRES